VQTDIIGEEH